MAIRMVGIDHNSAGIDIRGAFSFTKKLAQQTYDGLRQTAGLRGCVILSTCNRMEFWLSVDEGAAFSPLELLCERLGLNAAQYASYFTARQDKDAVEHLFRLAAGMESRIIGEDQIITQVGEALELARICYAADHVLEVLFRLAVTAAKRVKTEAAFSAADQSVIHIALQTLEQQGLSFCGKRCLVIGNGMMGRLSAQTLLDRGAEVTVTVRQYRSGIVDIPFGCKRINYTDRYSLLPDCDLVVSATSSLHFTLRAEDLAALQVSHPILLIDLAVPRDIDPAAGALPWATLYDIDYFRIDPLQSARLLAAMEKAQIILDEEQEHFYSWYECRDLVPQIQRLKQCAGAEVGGKMLASLRRTPFGKQEKDALAKEASGAAERMMNHLLFGLRGRLSDDELRRCIDAMEAVLSEPNTRA